MDQNNRISVRINGKKKSFESTTDKQSATAAKEEKTFQWVLPESTSQPNVVGFKEQQKQHQEWKKKNANRQVSKLPVHRKKKKYKRPVGKKKIRSRKTSPKQQWLSGFSAIIVGIIMGMIVLAVFTDHPGKNSGTSVQQNAAQTTAQGSTAATSGSANLDLSLEMVQGAVFKSQSDGKTAANGLKKQGFAAILQDKNSKVHMLIGVGMDKNQTDALGKLYKKQGQNVWVKNYPVQINGGKLNAKVRRFLGEAQPVMTKLIEGSVKGLTSGKTSITSKQWSGIENQMKQLKSDVGSKTKPLMSDLSSAVKGIQKYRKNSDSSQLWHAQQALLKAVVDYQNAGK